MLYGHHKEGFPLVEAQFEAALKNAMEKEYTLSEDGTTRIEVAKGGISAIDASDILVYEASQEDVDAVRWMTEKASHKMIRYKEIEDIIDEEAQAYFQGQKSFSEVAAIIQNRITLYLEEQM